LEYDPELKLIPELKLLLLLTLLDWTNASGVFTFNSLPDMLGFCTFYVI